MRQTLVRVALLGLGAILAMPAYGATIYNKFDSQQYDRHCDPTEHWRFV